MRKKLTRHGEDLVLVLDRPLLDLVNADADTSFEVSTDGQALILSPVREAGHREKFQAALEKANSDYGQTLRDLAE